MDRYARPRVGTPTPRAYGPVAQSPFHTAHCLFVSEARLAPSHRTVDPRDPCPDATPAHRVRPERAFSTRSSAAYIQACPGTRSDQ